MDDPFVLLTYAVNDRRIAVRVSDVRLVTPVAAERSAVRVDGVDEVLLVTESAEEIVALVEQAHRWEIRR